MGKINIRAAHHGAGKQRLHHGRATIPRFECKGRAYIIAALRVGTWAAGVDDKSDRVPRYLHYNPPALKSQHQLRQKVPLLGLGPGSFIWIPRATEYSRSRVFVRHICCQVLCIHFVPCPRHSPLPGSTSPHSDHTILATGKCICSQDRR